MLPALRAYLNRLNAIIIYHLAQYLDMLAAYRLYHTCMKNSTACKAKRPDGLIVRQAIWSMNCHIVQSWKVIFKLLALSGRYRRSSERFMVVASRVFKVRNRENASILLTAPIQIM